MVARHVVSQQFEVFVLGHDLSLVLGHDFGFLLCRGLAVECWATDGGFGVGSQFKILCWVIIWGVWCWGHGLGV